VELNFALNAILACSATCRAPVGAFSIPPAFGNALVGSTIRIAASGLKRFSGDNVSAFRDQPILDFGAREHGFAVAFVFSGGI
jgi:hypothetical protein